MKSKKRMVILDLVRVSRDLAENGEPIACGYLIRAAWKLAPAKEHGLCDLLEKAQAEIDYGSPEAAIALLNEALIELKTK